MVLICYHIWSQIRFDSCSTRHIGALTSKRNMEIRKEFCIIIVELSWQLFAISNSKLT